MALSSSVRKYERGTDSETLVVVLLRQIKSQAQKNLKKVLINMSKPWKINYRFWKASFGSYCILMSQHTMSVSSHVHEIYHDVSTAAPLCGSISDSQAAILHVLILTSSQVAILMSEVFRIVTVVWCDASVDASCAPCKNWLWCQNWLLEFPELRTCSVQSLHTGYLFGGVNCFEKGLSAPLKV